MMKNKRDIPSQVIFRNHNFCCCVTLSIILWYVYNICIMSGIFYFHLCVYQRKSEDDQNILIVLNIIHTKKLYTIFSFSFYS